MEGREVFRDQGLAGATFERQLLRGVLAEEWEHRIFAERDLDVLEARLDG